MKRFCLSNLIVFFLFVFILIPFQAEAGKDLTFKKTFNFITFDFDEVKEPVGNEFTIEFVIPKKLKKYRKLIWAECLSNLEGRRDAVDKEMKTHYDVFLKNKANFLENFQDDLDKAKSPEDAEKAMRTCNESIEKDLEGLVKYMKVVYKRERREVEKTISNTVESVLLRLETRKLIDKIYIYKKSLKTMKIGLEGTFNVSASAVKGIAKFTGSLLAAPTGVGIALPIITALTGAADFAKTVVKECNKMRKHLMKVREKNLNQAEIAVSSINTALDKVDDYEKLKAWKKDVDKHYKIYKKAVKKFDNGVAKLRSKSAKMQEKLDKLEKKIVKAEKLHKKKGNEKSEKVLNKTREKFDKLEKEVDKLNNTIIALHELSDDYFLINDRMKELMKAKKKDQVASAAAGAIPTVASIGGKTINLFLEQSKTVIDKSDEIADFITSVVK